LDESPSKPIPFALVKIADDQKAEIPEHRDKGEPANEEKPLGICSEFDYFFNVREGDAAAQLFPSLGYLPMPIRKPGPDSVQSFVLSSHVIIVA
jgi:hypothetical protein